jgi:hypothetical protein
VSVTLEVHPTTVPAADLPLGMVHDVARVLRAHGLDPDLLALSTALYRVVMATSVEDGGAADSLPSEGVGDRLGFRDVGHMRHEASR